MFWFNVIYTITAIGLVLFIIDGTTEGYAIGIFLYFIFGIIGVILWLVYLGFALWSKFKDNSTTLDIKKSKKGSHKLH